MNNEFLVRFGGDSHIRLETLTDFLENYRRLFYLINRSLGYSDEDLIVEVSPPEEGSFKLKINPKYESQLLKTMGAIVSGTLSGLLIIWISTNDNKLSVEDVTKIIESINSKNKTEIATQVVNNYEQVEVKKTINNVFKVVVEDENITSLDVSQDSKKIISVPKSDFQKYIISKSELIEESVQAEKCEIINVTIIIKTVHFEGEAKWGFIWNGYPIRASMKDQIFIKKLNTEPFKRGDILNVRLQKKSYFNGDLNSYIVDEKSYEVIEVLSHRSKVEGDNYTLSFKD